MITRVFSDTIGQSWTMSGRVHPVKRTAEGRKVAAEIGPIGNSPE